MVGRGSWWWWWRMRPVDGRQERADQQSVIWYWPHLVLVLCCCALCYSSCSSLLLLLFANRRRTHQLVAALPYPKQQHTRTHVHTLPVSPVREFRQCTSVRRVATLVLFFAPLSFRLLLATSGCCCFVWVGGCCAMQLPREATTTQPDELMLQLQSSPSQLLIRASAAASDQPTAAPAMHQISPKIESTDSSFNNNNNGHSDVSSSNIFLDPFFFETLVEDLI